MKTATTFLIGAFAAVAALGAGVEITRRSMYPAAAGVELLTGMGYSAVTGGRRDFFNLCGKDVFARTYEARNPAGKAVRQTVCFGILTGPYREPFIRP